MTKANVRPISGLPLAAAPDGTETFPVVQQGAAVAMTIDRVAALAVQRFNVVLPTIPRFQAFSASLAEFGAFGTGEDESAQIQKAADLGVQVYCAPPRNQYYSCQGIEFTDGTVFEGDSKVKAHFRLLPNATKDLFLSKDYWRNVSRRLVATAPGGSASIQIPAEFAYGIVQNAALYIFLDNNSIHVCNVTSISGGTLGINPPIPAGRNAPFANPVYDLSYGWGPVGHGVRNLFLNGNQAGQSPGQDNIAVVTPSTIGAYVPGALAYGITFKSQADARSLVTRNPDGSFTPKASFRLNRYVEIYCEADETANEFYVYGNQRTNAGVKINYDDSTYPRLVVKGGAAGTIVRTLVDLNEVTGLYVKNVPAGRVKFGMSDGPGSGNGLLFYGTHFGIHDILVENCKGVGWRTDWLVGGGGFSSIIKSQQAIIRDINCHLCDGGNFIHNGPNDTSISNSISGFGHGDSGYVGWLGSGVVFQGGHTSGANSGLPTGVTSYDYTMRGSPIIEPVVGMRIECDTATLLEMKVEEATKAQIVLRANNAKVLGGRSFFIDSAAGAQATAAIQIGEQGWAPCTGYEIDTKLTDIGTAIRVVNDGGWGKIRAVGFKGDLATTCVPLVGTLVSGINASDIEIDIVGATPKRFHWGSPGIEIDAVITPTSGALGSYTAKHRYLVQGARVTESLRVVITNLGTASGFLKYTPASPIAPIPGVPFTVPGYRLSDLAMMHWSFRPGDATAYLLPYNGQSGITMAVDTYYFSGARERLC